MMLENAGFLRPACLVSGGRDPYFTSVEGFFAVPRYALVSRFLER